MRDATGQFQPQPPVETILPAGDVVMPMGTGRTMELFSPSGTRART